MKKSVYRRFSKIEKGFSLVDEESELFDDDEETKIKGIEAFIELSDTNEEIKDFYDFTRDSFRVEGYQYNPFDEKIEIAI